MTRYKVRNYCPFALVLNFLEYLPLTVTAELVLHAGFGLFAEEISMLTIHT